MYGTALHCTIFRQCFCFPLYPFLHTRIQVDATGAWSSAANNSTLPHLRALEANVHTVLAEGKGKGSGSSAFRLGMLAEVLSLIVPPLEATAAAAAKGEGKGMDVVDA